MRVLLLGMYRRRNREHRIAAVRVTKTSVQNNGKVANLSGVHVNDKVPARTK